MNMIEPVTPGSFYLPVPVKVGPTNAKKWTH